MVDKDMKANPASKQAGRIEDLTNKVFGKLTVVRLDEKRTNSGRIKWIVKCQCGNEKSTQAINLKSGDTTSCGCVHKEQLGARKFKHGGSSSSEYASWCSMLTRCRNPNIDCFIHYGGRGITVCERWLDFANFVKDMGKKPNKNFTLERVNTNGNYEPDNCRWASQAEQVRNTRSNIRIGDKILVDIARDMNVSPSTLYGRIRKGWSIADTISTPIRNRKS